MFNWGSWLCLSKSGKIHLVIGLRLGRHSKAPTKAYAGGRGVRSAAFSAESARKDHIWVFAHNQAGMTPRGGGGVLASSGTARCPKITCPLGMGESQEYSLAKCHMGGLTVPHLLIRPSSPAPPEVFQKKKYLPHPQQFSLCWWGCCPFMLPFQTWPRQSPV